MVDSMFPETCACLHAYNSSLRSLWRPYFFSPRRPFLLYRETRAGASEPLLGGFGFLHFAFENSERHRADDHGAFHSFGSRSAQEEGWSARDLEKRGIVEVFRDFGLVAFVSTQVLNFGRSR